MKKLLSFSLLLVMLTFGLLVGCDSDNSDADKKAEDEHENETETASSDFPLTVTDALDEKMTIEEKPERIVSLIPSNTEIAFALGLEEEIVGVSDQDNYPEEVEEKESVGGMELNVEAIVGLEPDLVLAHASSVANSEGALEQIRDAGIQVFVVEDAQQIDETYASIKQIGKVTGTTDKAHDIVADMKEDFASLSDKMDTVAADERQEVFFEVAPAPDIFTAGQDTFFADLLEVINADNAAQEQDGWVQMDPEAVVELDPDVIITTYGTDEGDPADEVMNRDGWENVTAVEKEQVYDIDPDLVSRPGPRLVEGAKEIAQVVYPEVFTKE